MKHSADHKIPANVPSCSDAKGTNSSAPNPVVNLTGIAGETERYLSQERLDDSLSSVDCTNTSIKFTFKNQVDLEVVLQSWQWLNVSNRTVTIVLNSGTCGNERRQPYIARRMTFSGMSATAEATRKTWREAMPRGKLRLNTKVLRSPPVSTGGLKKREQHTLDLSADLSGQKLLEQNIKSSGLSASVECKQCRTRGSLDLDIDVDIGLSGAEGTVQILSSGLGAETSFEVRTVRTCSNYRIFH